MEEREQDPFTGMKFADLEIIILVKNALDWFRTSVYIPDFRFLISLKKA